MSIVRDDLPDDAMPLKTDYSRCDGTLVIYSGKTELDRTLACKLELGSSVVLCPLELDEDFYVYWQDDNTGTDKFGKTKPGGASDALVNCARVTRGKEGEKDARKVTWEFFYVAKPPKPGVYEEEATPPTRLQMIEYLSVRGWWTEGQKALLFTAALWGFFVIIVWLRLDVEAAHEVNNSLETYFMNIVAEPSKSGVNPRPAAETPLPCRCACQGSKLGAPVGPCGGPNSAGQSSEDIDFIGEVGPNFVQQLGLVDSGADVARAMHWDNITSVKDAWYWVEHGVLPAVWKPPDGRADSATVGFILRRNLVIGGLRVRQLRSKPADKCEVSEGLLNYYPTRCRSEDLETDTFRNTGLTMFENNSLARKAFKPVADKEGEYDALLDIEMPMATALDTVGLLAKSDWVDDLTQKFTVESVLLNAETGVYALLVITMDFPESGEIVKDIRVRSLMVLDASLGLMDYLPEIIWLILIILLIRQELAQIMWAVKDRLVCEYFCDLWNLMDWVSIFLGVPVAFYWWVISLQTYALTDDVVALPRANANNAEDRATQWSKLLDDVFSIFYVKQFHAFLLFWYTVIITLRFLKNFLTQQKLATIQFALSSSFFDTGHYLIMYVVIFANFVLGGRILFGGQMDQWSSFQDATSSALRMLMGHFDFKDMYEIAPISATVWFWLFLMVMIFLLSNILLAIIADHFTSVREAVGDTPAIWHDAYLGFWDLLWRFEWRIEQFRDGEYKDCFWNNPYHEVLEGEDGLLLAAEVDEKFKKAMRRSCLGVRLFRKQMDSASLFGLTDDGSAGGVLLDQRSLRSCGATPFCADHILEKCQDFLSNENTKSMNQVQQFRHLVKLLAHHKILLDRHCTNLEAGVEEDKEHLWQALKRLERSTRASLENFRSLRSTGIDTLAPPIQSKHKLMLAGNQMEKEMAAQQQQMALEDAEGHYHDNVLRGAAQALEDGGYGGQGYGGDEMVMDPYPSQGAIMDT